MIHIHYDVGWVIGSIVVALVACFFAVSIEQMLFRGNRPKYEKLILVMSGAVLGLAIWCMHFVGMTASHMPTEYRFDVGLTFTSYIIAFIALAISLSSLLLDFEPIWVKIGVKLIMIGLFALIVTIRYKELLISVYEKYVKQTITC